MSKLLINERQLQVLPTLAMRLGLNEAIAVQQLHFAVTTFESRVVEIDGRRWLRADLAWWAEQFPWWSESTIKRIWANTRERGIVHTSRGREANVYAIDYEALGQIDPSETSDRPVQTAQVDLSPCIGEGTTKSTEENSTTGDDSPALFETEAQAPSPSPAPASAPSDIDVKTERIWSHFEQAFPGRTRGGLTEPRKRDIKKALKAVNEDDEMCMRAIDGFKLWLEANQDRGRPSITRVLATGMNDRKNLTDKIVDWADYAGEHSAKPKGHFPIAYETMSSVMAGTVKARLRDIASMLQLGSEDAVQRGEAAVNWLREHFSVEPVIQDGKVIDWKRL